MMPDSRIDAIIKESLQIFEKEPERATSQCPSDNELAHYITCAISDEPPGEGLLRHITECDFCFKKTASAVSCLTGFNKEMVPDRGRAGALQRAKSIPSIYPKARKSYMKRNRYLFIAAIFFILSFLFKGYFLQFLVAASIFGLKWIMDTGGSKALIMIYDAWQHKKEQKGDEEKSPPLIKNRDRHRF